VIERQVSSKCREGFRRSKWSFAGLLFACALLTLNPLNADEHRQLIQTAWQHVIQSSGERRWFVLSLPTGEYIQCESYGKKVSCPLPIWNSTLPKEKFLAPSDFSATPHPELAGAIKKVLLPGQHEGAIKQVLQSYNRQASEQFFNLYDRNGQISGTGKDMIFELKVDDSKAIEIIEKLFTRGYKVKNLDKLALETD